MTGLLSLKWNNHSTAFLQCIGKIHLKEKYCDATIICQGEYFPVHRVVLSSCSLYFDEMFEMIKTPHPYIVFKDINPRDLELLLNYMYKGEINVEQELLPTLIKAAESLKIKGIAVPDDFPSTKTSNDRKRNSTTDSSSNAKRRTEDFKKPHATKMASTNRSSNCNNFSDTKNTYSSEDSLRLHPAQTNLEDSKLPSIKEEPLEVIDFDEASNFINEPTKDTFDIYANLPEKCESEDYIAAEDLANVEADNSELTHMNSFNDSSSIAKMLSHEEQNNNPESSLESLDMESQANRVNVIDLKSAGESRPECRTGASFNDERLSIASQNFFQDPLVNEEGGFAKPFHCQICNRYFALKQHLQNHMHVHTGIKNFACTKCSKRFALKQHLQIHLRVHTGEKPYSCKRCPKKFRQKSHLNSHMACVHNI